MRPHFVHLHPRVPLVHVVDVERDQVEQLLPLRVVQFRRRKAGVVEDDIVLPRLGEILLPVFDPPEDGFLALRSVSALISASPWFCSSCRIDVPLYFPDVATTGSEPANTASSPPDRRARSS